LSSRSDQVLSDPKSKELSAPSSKTTVMKKIVMNSSTALSLHNLQFCQAFWLPQKKQAVEQSLNDQLRRVNIIDPAGPGIFWTYYSRQIHGPASIDRRLSTHLKSVGFLSRLIHKENTKVVSSVSRCGHLDHAFFKTCVCQYTRGQILS
jgi:hypothetical protein